MRNETITGQSIYNVYTLDMQTKISKWGNSLGIRIPKEILEFFRLNIDSRVEISQTKEGILIKPCNQGMTLDEMLATITPDQLPPLLVDIPDIGKEIID